MRPDEQQTPTEPPADAPAEQAREMTRRLVDSVAAYEVDPPPPARVREDQEGPGGRG